MVLILPADRTVLYTTVAVKSFSSHHLEIKVTKKNGAFSDTELRKYFLPTQKFIADSQL